MRKLIWLSLFAAGVVSAQLIYNQPTVFTTGATLTINTGVPLLGTWDLSGATVIGVPPPTIHITSNATGSGTTTIPITINTIPDLVSAPGSIVSTNIAAPVAPSSGFDKWFTDSTGKRFHDRNDTGSTATTVIGTTPAPYQVITVINPSTGVVTVQYPQFPTSDPGVFGAGYWSGGVLHQSLASPTPTSTSTPTATATATATSTATNTPTPTPTP